MNILEKFINSLKKLYTEKTGIELPIEEKNTNFRNNNKNEVDWQKSNMDLDRLLVEMNALFLAITLAFSPLWAKVNEPIAKNILALTFITLRLGFVSHYLVY